MPTYIVTAPDGKKYKVTGEGSKEQALAHIREQHDAQNRQYGAVLPFSRGPEGLRFDMSAGIPGFIGGVLKRGGQAVSGELPIFDPQTGHVSDEAISLGTDTAMLALPANPAIRAGDKAIPGVTKTFRRPDVPAPTAQALREAGSTGYDAARKMGVDYSSDAVASMAGQMRTGLEQEGILAELAPKTFKILEKLQQPPEGSVAPLEGLVAARRALKNARLDFTNPTEKLAADRLIRGLDEFIEGRNASSVVAGPASRAAETLKDANANYAAAKRSDRITGKLEDADLQAGVANSGQNIDNAIRQRARDILKSDKLKAGFNKEEIKAITNVAMGSKSRNALRFVGNLLGGGGGLGAVASGAAGGTAGGMLGGPPGIAIGAGIPLAGLAAKRSGASLTRRAMEKAGTQTRKRSPLYEEMIKSAEWKAASPAQRSAMFKAFLAYINNQQFEGATVP